MRLPGAASLFFLAYILVFLPWVAFRSARALRPAGEGSPARPLPSREGIWIGTLFSQGALLFLAWLTGRQFGYRLFELPALGVRDALAALMALGVFFELRRAARAIHSEDERRRMVVYLLAPRTPRERALWIATGLVASVAEEAAYRGVGMSILWYSLGSPWPAALVCATAFALAHWTQGWKSALVVFAMAMVMHGLVALTGALVLAMLVHAVYDLVAGYLIAREARRYDQEAAAAAASDAPLEPS